MRSPSISQLLAWRWAPCVGLVLGSLSFVALALAFIPDHLGAPPAASEPQFFVAPPKAATLPTAAARPAATAFSAATAVPTVTAPESTVAPESAMAPESAAAPSTDEQREPTQPRSQESAAERHARRRHGLAGRVPPPLSDPVPAFFPDQPPPSLPPPLPDTPPPPEPPAQP